MKYFAQHFVPWVSRYYRVIAAFLVILLCAVVGPRVYTYVHVSYEGYACEREQSSTLKRVECFNRILTQEFRSGQIVGALRAFFIIQRHYPSLLSGGDCHLAAHYIGDMTYFQAYLSHPDLDSIYFPPESTFCVFGLFHGFFEHLFQNQPTLTFITETCDYFERRYSDSIPGIRSACYHGVGHGLMLANAEHVPRAQYGDPFAFIIQPLSACDEMVPAVGNYREQCRQGLFTLLVEWMTDHQYGLAFDSKNPFAICTALKSEWQHMCYDQIADRFYGNQQLSIDAMARDVLKRVLDRRYVRVALETALSGAVIRQAGSDTFAHAVAACDVIDATYQDTCVSAFVRAIFNAGTADEMTTRAFAFCSSADVVSRDMAAYCYESIGQHLRRFFREGQIRTLCEAAPAEFQGTCIRPPSGVFYRTPALSSV